MGPDESRRGIRRAPRPEPDNFHEVVCLGGGREAEGEPERQSLFAGLAAAGHRVFLVSDRGRGSAAPYELRETAPRSFEVSLRDPADSFAALDALRREADFGAAAAIVGERRWLETAERFRRERAWAVVSPDERGRIPELARAFPPLSIVVVTYNNRELNRLCLGSLFARTEWPNFEVLVVDNASSDGTPDLVRELARTHPNLSLIALPANRGFPAAVNKGLSRAAGLFSIVLNNDTVVTRGWATALIRHLTDDPRIGLIGPQTNAIANEARVEAGYSDLRELPAWAAAWTRAHDGETFPISMAAFFCVALRREVFDAVGPLDERFGLGLFEDRDYNRRVREKGWEVRCARDSFVHHWQMASFRRLGQKAYLETFEENRRRYEEKWAGASEPAEPP